MKHILIILLFLISVNTFSQYFVPFAEDSLYNSYSSPAVVYSMHSDSTGLYVGGKAIHFGGAETLYQVGKFQDGNWYSLDNGFGDPSGSVYCIINYEDDIYIGGEFSDIQDISLTDYIGRFNGTNWEAVPNSYGDVSSTVYDMVLYDNKLVIGGGFSNIGGIYYNFPFIAAYDGTDYISMDTLPFNVNALEVFNGELYAGGGWTTVKKYTNNQYWEDVGGQLSYYVQEMIVDTVNNLLYVSGSFNIVDDSILTDAVAIWDGFKWSPIGDSGTANDITAMTIYRGDLYCNSGLDTISGVFTGYLAKWDGSDWSPGVPGGINFGVTSLMVHDDILWIGGTFPIDGTMQCPMDTARKTLARWYLPPDTTCKYLKPRVQTYKDTFYIDQAADFYNNNAYVQSWQWDFGDSGTANIKDPTHVYSDAGTYNICVTVNDTGCVKTACKTIVVKDPVGINGLQVKEGEFKLYPNPTSTVLYIETASKHFTDKEMTVVDTSGKTVMSGPLQRSKKQTVDISSLPKGTYIVKIGKQTGKFVKE